MEHNYCLEECPIGKKYKEYVLQKHDSVFDAVYEYKKLINVCMFICNKFKYEKE